MKTRESFINSTRKFRFKSLVALLTGVSVLLSGCVSMRSVPLPVSGQPTHTVAVKVGDKAQVQTKSGETFVFTVTAVESDTLAGKSESAGKEVRVKYQDIASLQVERVDAVRTSLAGVGTVLIIVGVAALVFVLSSGIHMGSM
jgi:hypothetical protein